MMEEVGGGVLICDGDDEPTMKTWGRDDREATGRRPQHRVPDQAAKSEM